MADHPNTVFTAENSKLAEAVIQLLAGQGIEAEAVSQPAHVESDPLTGASEGVASEEFVIRVTDATKVAAAKELLDSAVGASMVKAVREKRASRTGTTTATCEDCGKPSAWPAAVMGTTEVCPHCGGYMDIPDPDDDFAGMDFGEEEDAPKEEKEENEK